MTVYIQKKTFIVLNSYLEKGLDQQKIDVDEEI